MLLFGPGSENWSGLCPDKNFRRGTTPPPPKSGGTSPRHLRGDVGGAHPGSILPPFPPFFRPVDTISQKNDSISIQFHSFTSENDDTI